MPNRCRRNVYAYCSGEPKVTTKTQEWSVTPGPDNKNTGKRTESLPWCKLDPISCGKYTLPSERAE